MYLVFVDWNGDVSYGIDTETNLLGIFEKEEDAIALVSEWGVMDPEEKTINADWALDIPESAWRRLSEAYPGVGPSEYCDYDSGHLSIRYSLFRPGMFTGGGWYLE